MLYSRLRRFNLAVRQQIGKRILEKDRRCNRRVSASLSTISDTSEKLYGINEDADQGNVG
jgi:hypothetical protein